MLMVGIPTPKAGTHTVEIYKLSETIKTIDPEFLPAGVGGGGAMVGVITQSGSVAVCDKQYSEIREAWVNNIPCFMRMITQGDAGLMFWPVCLTYPSDGEVEEMHFVALTGNALMLIKFNANGEITPGSVSLS